MTVRMDQMRTVNLSVNPVVRQSSIPMSKPGQQDTGKSQLLKINKANLFGITVNI